MRNDMQLRRYALASAMALIATAPSAFAQDRRLSLEMRPAASVTDAQFGQVIITVDAGALTNATLSLEPPPGFKVEPQSFQLTGAAPIRRMAVLQRVDAGVASGSRRLLARLTEGTTTPTVTDTALEFAFINTTISTSKYLLLGLFGVMVGYLIKLLMKVFSAIPAPPPPNVQPNADPVAEGPITRFIKAHYYTADFLFTLAIGALVLLANLAGTAPQPGTQWPSAIVFGAGIGVLANNDLIARLKPR
jgi:hypothetical protein